MATGLGERKQFNPVKLRLKFELVSHPACAKGLLKMFGYMDKYKCLYVYVCVYACVNIYIYIYI